MRKLLPLLLALLLGILPAMAESKPDFHEDVLLLRSANRALEAQYGLTPHHLGLFDTEISRYGDAAVVRYIPRSRPHPSLTGEYLVLVTSSGTQALWTHDDIDPAVWQSGELTSPAWGAPQLTAYLTAGSFDREYFDDPYIREAVPTLTDMQRFTLSGGEILESRLGELTEAEIATPAALGRAAVQQMYALSDEAAAELHVVGVTLYRLGDVFAQWQVVLYSSGEPDEANYIVRIDGQTLQILSVRIQTGGIG